MYQTVQHTSFDILNCYISSLIICRNSTWVVTIDEAQIISPDVLIYKANSRSLCVQDFQKFEPTLLKSKLVEYFFNSDLHPFASLLPTTKYKWGNFWLYPLKFETQNPPTYKLDLRLN